jgi:hypothetical protein
MKVTWANRNISSLIIIIANKILKSNTDTHLTGLYTAERAAGATAPPPPAKKI